MPRTAIAFVESPLQFLSALEAHDPEDDLLIRARANAKGMSSFLDAFDPEWLPANVRLERQGAKPGILRSLNPSVIYLGDPCSGQIHKALSVAYLERKMPHIVLLDDGLATYSTIETLGRQARAARPSQAEAQGPPGCHGRLHRRPSARPGGFRTVAVAHRAPVPKGLRTKFLRAGGEITRHRFEHLQSAADRGRSLS